MRQLKSALTVLVAVLVLVTCADYAAFAATGKSFVLGKINSANKQTTLTRTTPGPALKLKTKSTANPPLVVNGKGKVANLNADKIDGLDSSALTTKPYVFTRRISSPVTGSFQMNFPVPPGSYLMSYSAFLAASPSVDLSFVDCYFVQVNGSTTRFVGESNFDTGGRTTAGAGGSGFVTKLSSAGILRLICGAGAPFVNGSGDDEPIQVVLTPVNGSTAAAARMTSGARTKH